MILNPFDPVVTSDLLELANTYSENSNVVLNDVYSRIARDSNFDKLREYAKIIDDENEIDDDDIINYRTFFQKYKKEIINFNKVCTVKEAIRTIIDMHIQDVRLYGAIIVIDGKPLNIFHPLIAMYIISKYEEDIKYDINILLYPLLDEFTDDEEWDIEIYQEQIKVLISSYLTHNDIKEKTTDLIIIKDYGDKPAVKIITELEKLDTDANNGLDIMIPVHLLTAGTYIPYYGTILTTLLDNGRNGVGINLSPMLSGNIKSIDDGDFKNNHCILCTGSEPTNHIKGLVTLEHCNMDSAWDKRILANYSFKYADICVSSSIDIYRTINWFNIKEEPIINRSEYEHECNTLAKYVLNYGNQRSIIEIKKEYEDEQNRRDRK